MASGSKDLPTKTASADSKDVFFHRLVRSMSGRDIVNGNAAAAEPTVISMGHQDSENVLPLTRTQSATSLSSQVSQKGRFNVGDRLKRLSQGLPQGLRRYSKSEPASPRVTSVEVENRDMSARDIATGHGKMLSMVDERVEDDHSGTNLSSAKTDDSLSPTTLAQRLRDLIDPLPFPSYSYPIKSPKLPARDKKGRPIPPQASSPIKDPKLVELLSSATFMNGLRSGDKSRPSVWELLEGLGIPPHGFPEAQSTEPDNGDGDRNDQPVDNQPDYSGTSVMVYSPLIPGKDDIVELGELLPVSVEEEVYDTQAASKSWTSIWPLSMFPNWPHFRTQAAAMEAPLGGGFPEDFIVHSSVTTVDDSGKKLRVKTTSAWVPSTTKVSFQVMWWGYRLWLPPPVMAVLSDHSLEMSKRATLIATALAWFFNNLPLNIFPPQVRPVILLMQRIVPYLGYIATFISWSWSTIKSYDVGYGVTLTATWLLPIALIPGTWRETDVPKSPTQSPPTTLPGTSPTAPPSPPSQPPVDTPNGVATPSPSTPSPSQPSPPHSVPLPSKSPSSSPPPQPSTPAPGDPVISSPNSNLPQVSSPRGFARKLFALSPAKVPTGASSESLPTLMPIPPLPTPRSPVQTDSTLGEELLHAPFLRSIPLPSESSENLDVMNRRRKDKKTSPLFRRTVK